MRRVFADSYYFLAFLNPHDPCHGRAVRLSELKDMRITTTYWILTTPDCFQISGTESPLQIFLASRSTTSVCLGTASISPVRAFAQSECDRPSLFR